MRIDHVSARSVSDTRGRPTIETTLVSGEFSATASVPSGRSTGEHEAHELRDKDGSVSTAIENVQGEIASALTTREFQSLDELDAFLIQIDSTSDKSRLGANALLSVSLAAMRLSALEQGLPLWRAIAKRAGTKPSSPRLYVNVLNGGAHADFRLPFQEYILVVEGRASAAYEIAQQAFAKLGERLGSVPMGDEGGYSPTFNTLEEPFEILTDLAAEFSPTTLAIDAAATQLFQNEAYTLLGKRYPADEFSQLYGYLLTRFPLTSIEDPFEENAKEDFIRLTKSIGNKTTVVGDDYTCTNPARIDQAIDDRAVNAVLIKPNQIGTLKETIEAVRKTMGAGFKVIASHRSGETSDTFIADFAYGIGAYGLKAGGLGQSERVVKYERLVAIEREAEAV